MWNKSCEGHKSENKENKGHGKGKDKEIPYALLSAPTCDNEGIADMFNLLPGVEILRRHGEGGRREFLLGCKEWSMHIKNYNIHIYISLSVWPIKFAKTHMTCCACTN